MPTQYEITIKTARLIELIRERFYERLAHKTGWGRNELKLEFEAAITEALSQCLDEFFQASDRQELKWSI
jgi:hypothetical protein